MEGAAVIITQGSVAHTCSSNDSTKLQYKLKLSYKRFSWSM
jgi:hypothetical protein